MNNLSTRPATPADLPFIWSLRQATMKAMIEATYGWDEATQYEYAQESLKGEILLLDGQPVGVVTLGLWEKETHLVWVAIAPEFQGLGLGAQAIARAKEVACRRGVPCTLQVLRNNPAIGLYQRFGFEIYDENGPWKLLMRWPPEEEMGGEAPCKLQEFWGL